jgi:hypothetical protein
MEDVRRMLSELDTELSCAYSDGVYGYEQLKKATARLSAFLAGVAGPELEGRSLLSLAEDVQAWAEFVANADLRQENLEPRVQSAQQELDRLEQQYGLVPAG